MRWLDDMQKIFDSEPETWLAYNLGQNLRKIPHLSRQKPFKTGLGWQFIKIVFWLMKQSGIFRKPVGQPGEVQFFVFADSLNQMNALDMTIDSLRAEGKGVVAAARSDYRNNSERKARYLSHKFGIVDVFCGLVLLIKRAPLLYKELKKRNDVSVDWYFNQFCAAYFFMPYFYFLLRKLKPEIVITANDHNLPNRCMLAAAHALNVKTAYLQHASVGELFPALRVNYAFLDGMSALETYNKCEPNQPKHERDVPEPQIFLTGLKKKLDEPRRRGGAVGVAVNVLDEAGKAVTLVNKIVERGHDVCFRWHPGQRDGDVRYFRRHLANSKGVTLSNPLEESVNSYLNKVRVVVAGNTSLLFEAAVSRAQPIYYELQPLDTSDVYGFVRNGLAEQAHSERELLELVSQSEPWINEEAVRFYSRTFDTEWEGKEGKLVAECLIKLSSGAHYSDMYWNVPFFSRRPKQNAPGEKLKALEP